MATVLFFDTSVGTFNHGDDIIMKSVYNEFRNLLKNNYRLNYATHLVNYTALLTDKAKIAAANNAEYKFICGTDLLWEQIWKQIRCRTLQFSLINIYPNVYKNAICLGVGSKNMGKLDSITKKIYKRNLSSTFIHSVRDNAAEKTLDSMGFKVINTGCPTLWSLTKEHCADIPTHKAESDRVVFALTSENRNPEQDKATIDILRRNYKKLYFWVQHWTDDKYLKELTDISDIELVFSLDEYDRILNTDIDYVGTRLHGGVYALQHKKRAIVISIDHRALGMSVENNLPCISRNKIDKLDELINSSFETNIKLNSEGIKIFKNQFM